MRLRRFSSCVLVVLVLVLVYTAPAAARTHAYLLRGIFNVSVGLDALAAKLNRMGVAATVYGHGESGSVASEAIRDYRAHKISSVVLIGHSLGADAAVGVAEQLKNAGIPVSLLITLDGASTMAVPPNVRRAVNFHVDRGQITAAPGFRGSLQNINLNRVRGMDHMTIQSTPAMHRRMIGYVAGAGGGTARTHAAPPEAKSGAEPAS
jgi:Thioesterase domain